MQTRHGVKYRGLAEPVAVPRVPTTTPPDGPTAPDSRDSGQPSGRAQADGARGTQPGWARRRPSPDVAEEDLDSLQSPRAECPAMGADVDYEAYAAAEMAQVMCTRTRANPTEHAGKMRRVSQGEQAAAPEFCYATPSTELRATFESLGD